jgi:DNA-binding response OmpR family regulator
MNPRILIAEDNPETRELLRRLLSKEPFRADLVTTGMEVVSYYRHAQRESDPYHALILDVAMPFKTGLTAAREIRAGDDCEEAPGSATPIVLMTALNPSEIEPDAHAINATVLQKPFAPGELLSLLRELTSDG